MNQANAEQIEIYVGMPIGHRSEQKLIYALARFAEARATPLLVLANFELGGRQFDFVVVTQTRVCVVDAKASAFPIRGDLNGMWEHLLPGRSWVSLTNGYQQVLERKNLLRNALPDVPNNFYPEAAVVFAEPPPDGSTLTKGDFKATVYPEVESFLEELAVAKRNPLSLDEWRAWARRLRLARVPLAEATDNESGALLRHYRAAFKAEYGPQAVTWIPENDDQKEAIARALSKSSGVYLMGPSGCGKTLMMKSAATALAQAGDPVIFLQGKEIGSTLLEALRTEIGLVGDASFENFRRAIKETSEPLCIFLDGINEVPTANLQRVLRGLATLARRLGARIVASGQKSCPPQLSTLSVLNIAPPGTELKRKIASAVSGPLSPAAVQLLALVQSGFEAAMTGELQDELGSEASRSHLVDQYIRKRLARNARPLAAALGALASTMFTQHAFSVAESSFDDFMLSRGLSDEDFETLFASTLIERRAGRVSFSHEMLFYGSAARSYLNQARGNPQEIAATFNAAFGEPLAIDVLAAEDDEQTILAVLHHIQNPELLMRVTAGEAGVVARAAADRLLEAASGRIEDQISSLTLQISGRSVVWSSEPHCTLSEKAQYQALGLAFNRGRFVEDYMRLCRAMDVRLDEERARLLVGAANSEILLKSESFALAYPGLFGGRNVGFTLMIGASHPFLDRKGRSNWLHGRTLKNLTSGELYAVMEHTWLFFGEDSGSLCLQLADVIETRLSTEPYHVQLSLLHNAGLVRNAPGSESSRLVEAIQNLDVGNLGLAISTSVVDALKHLGALDDEAEEARSSIREQVTAAVLAQDDEDGRETALWIYGAQFDHPYDHIFYEEVTALPPEQKRTLLLRAFSAERLRQSFSLLFIMREVSVQNDRAHSPLFRRFAVCPQVNPMWQDEIGAFTLATRFLTRHRATLPEAPISTDSERCFYFLREIIAAAEVGTQIMVTRATEAWRQLLTLPLPLVMSNLRDVAQEGLVGRDYDGLSSGFRPIQLTQLFPEGMLAIARGFVQGRESAKSDRGFVDQQATEYGCRLIGRLGNRGDLGLLRSVLSIPAFSKAAIDAIAEIERRY